MFDKKEKQLIRLVEVIALSALMASNPSKQIEKRLREIAFPLEEWTCPVCLYTSLDDECPKCTEVYLDLEIE